MEIRTSVIPEAFTMPQIQQYSGTSDPVEYAELYRDQMIIKGVGDNAMCRMFPHTLTGLAKSWFRSLKAGSVSSLDQLLKYFVHKFGYASTQDITSSKLAFIKQGDSESLAEYVTCFHQEVLRTGKLISRALQQIEMGEKCNLKREEDRVEVLRNNEKPKRAEVPLVPS
ncbi:uncharacterized protein LOC112099334 [Citrus clementina]|uniref:uncharacterized protein LOC112099334 n=1 Tax=Citrus clementina TaxID=85681 RepID=UPI000CECE8B4|nr:uncharacterized protein LOC112099334 [Citrus x clementina]